MRIAVNPADPALLLKLVQEISDRLTRLEERLPAADATADPERLLSLAEVSARTGRAEWTLAEDCRDGRLVAVKQNRRWRVPLSEVRRLEQEGPRPKPEHAKRCRPPKTLAS